MIITLKDEILNILCLSEDFVSGVELANRLLVSRNAIWKAVKELCAAGYDIETARRRGYRLSKQNKKVFTAQLKRFCKGFDIVLLESTDSTNAYAKKLADSGAREGAVVLALSQRSGRGRLRKSFFSPEGGVYMSVVLRPSLSPEKVTLITVAAAVAAAKTVDEFSGKRSGIKWVNDIFIDSRKVCGILTEGSFGAEAGTLDYAVLGIGSNLCGSVCELPEEIRDTAGFITDKEFTSLLYSRFVGTLLTEFFSIYKDIESKNFIEEYRNRCILIGKEVTFVKDGVSHNAVVIGIDDDARLCVRENDTELKLDSGEVSVKWKKTV